MKMVNSLSKEELNNLIVNNFNNLSSADRDRIIGYYETYPFWGKLDPNNGTSEAFRGRADVLHNHYEDLLWLYNRLIDDKSKNVLYAIIHNWITFDSDKLASLTERENPEYYHKDIFPARNDEVFVDVGAFTGDSVANFIVTYGVTFKRIYCYEIAPDSFKILEQNLAGIPNIELKQKAVGASAGTMYIDFGKQVSSERVTDCGETTIEVVCIDEDITEPVSFIKMDIEGAEKDALQGSRNQIKNNKPHLAISTYHGYDDIHKIPRLIDTILPGYKFYMRYHGGNLVPTEFSLLAVF